MRLHEHAVVSGLVGAGLYGATRSLPLALGAFLAGVLIDLDHIPDYLVQHPDDTALRRFFVTCNEYRLRKLYLWLHSIELVLALGIAAAIFRGAVLAGLFIGSAQHLLLDQLTNRTRPGSYFFLYRWRQGFECKRIFHVPEEFSQSAGEKR